VKATPTDITLIERLRAGEVKAFDELYFLYHKAVFANIFRLVKKQEEAEELLQDVFTALWQKRATINAHQSVAGWLAVVSYHKAINHLNKRIQSVLIAHHIDPAEIANLPEITEEGFNIQLQVLNEAIEKLPLKKKQAFTLCKLEGKSYEEAATILGISPNTVKDHIVMATRFIKAYAMAQYPAATWSVIAILVATH